jgi:O-succinylbenzoic acid--CoA ligase
MLAEKRRMLASARITNDFLGLHEGDTALLCMSLDYIAGKMMVVRALTCGLKLIAVKPCGCPEWEGDVDFAAMVPMQVWNLVQQAPERLRQIRHLIIGGGAISDELADALKDMPNHIWSTYGMTETLSHIALRRLNGVERSEWYTPFDGVEVSLNEEECLVIHAPAVHEGVLVTNDIAELKDGKFRIKGRKDNVVCSGGIKIQIEEVERMLSAHLKVPFLITKKADKKFGEQVVLLTESIDVSNVKEVCQQVLPRYWQPRMYLHVAKIPLTETGKPARAEAEKMVRTYSVHQQ